MEKRIRTMTAPEVSAFYKGACACAMSVANTEDRTRMVLQALESLQDNSKYHLTEDGRLELASVLAQLLSERPS